VEGEILDATTDLESKLDFSKEGENWEATVKGDGSLVVAVDCTQDDAIVTAGRSRELMNGIQQLRKAAGLDLRDIVEVFFQEEEGVTIVEEAVSKNVSSFESKFKGSVPLPHRFAPSWSVPLKSDLVDVGGSKVQVLICRPSLAVKETVNEKALKVLSTLEPESFSAAQDFTFSVDGTSQTLKEGSDFFLSSASMLRATRAIEWL
jgi:isoleucyl-tRNA synthetase